MKKVLYIVTVLLVYYGIWVGADNGIGAGTILELIWGYAFLFMTEFVLFCALPVIVRYIIKREPLKNATELCFGGATLYIGVLIRTCKFSFIDLAIASAGICFGAWVSYHMLSK